MKLRVRAGKQSGCLDVGGDEETLGALRTRLRQTLLPSLGFSPDAVFSITLNGSDPLTEDGSSLEALGVVSGDLIVIVTDDIPAPALELPAPATASETEDGGYKRQRYEGEAAAGSPEGAEMEEAAPGCSPGPMLCSEAAGGEVPHPLEALYRSAHCACASDALVVLTHLLMLETGYRAQGVKNMAAAMPNDWRSCAGAYKLHYSHPLCCDSSAALLCLPMGSLLIINATLTIGGELRSVKRLQLRTASYITFPQEAGVVASVYRDLPKLSRLFKDQLAYPLLAATRQALGLPDVFGLVVLPPELKLRIFRLLDALSILSLGATCKDLHADTEDPALWRFLYRRDFRDGSERDPHTDWKELYKNRQSRCRILRRRPQPYVPFFPPIPPGPFYPDQSPPDFPFPPGIIGGEYDQRPTLPFAEDPLSLLNPRRPFEPRLFPPTRPRFNPHLPGHFGESSRSRRGPFL